DFSTAHTNPVESTSDGIFPAIYVNPGVNPTYKIVITDADDVAIYTEDDIPAAGISASDIGAVLYQKTDDETTAGVTPSAFAAVRPWVDAVKRYGLGVDGSSDNTSALTRMCSVSGQALFYKRGDYVTGRFFLPANTTMYLEPGTII